MFHLVITLSIMVKNNIAQDGPNGWKYPLTCIWSPSHCGPLAPLPPLGFL